MEGQNKPFPSGPLLKPPDGDETLQADPEVNLLKQRQVNPDDVGVVRAKRLAELLDAGEVDIAAVKSIVNQRNLSRKGYAVAQKTIEQYKLDAETRRELVRATVNKALIECMEERVGLDAEGNQITLPPNYKVALEAAKLAGADPEVGIVNSAPVQVGITIGAELSAAMDKLGDNVLEGSIVEEAK